MSIKYVNILYIYIYSIYLLLFSCYVQLCDPLNYSMPHYIYNFIYTHIHVSDSCIVLAVCQVLFVEPYKYFKIFLL